MEVKKSNQVKNAFDSILRADYLSLDNLEELNNLSNYYVDFFNSVSSILQKQDNYISGRRGTGKTTVLLKGYNECLKTIRGEESVYLSTKILPIYIDLSNCGDIFDKDNFDLFEIHFIRQIISSLKRQLESIYDEKHYIFFKKDNPAIDDLDYIEKVLISGLTISFSKSVDISDKGSSSTSSSSSLDITHKSLGVELSQQGTSQNENSKSYSSIQGLNTQEFLDCINSIIQKVGIDSVYIFLDEYSDLNEDHQLQFSKLLKSFLGSKTNIFVKIGVITDRFDFGDKIIIGRDIFPIPLDLNEHVERLGGLSPTLQKLESSIQELIQKRLDIYAEGIILDSLFKADKSEIILRVARESIGVTRTIGLILQNAWKQAEVKDHKIGFTEINYGIRSARKTYQKQYEGALKRKLIPGYYNDIWNSILKRANLEKSKHPDRAASHMLIDPNRSKYFNVFKENFLLHLLEEGRASKYGGNYDLYSIDYDICQDLNLKYAESKDEYTGIRFVYDDVLSEYDSYFTDLKLKSYKCPKCKKVYQENDFQLAVKVKRCFDDDEKLDEVIHQEFEVYGENLAEVEVKILGFIAMLNEDEALSAVEIANSVGCTRQKVSAWCSRVLEPKNEIRIVKKAGKNFYYG
ncbi:hypothetical protein [Psychrobacter maritimus]|uniref:hypothetical protein n=1 Tax=Psychrobacter maritimus TaxID=256325 RepID=UPI003563D308